MNLIPLADIVFLLLIFFLLGSSFVLQSGIRVQVPFSPFLLAPLENPGIIAVTAPPHSRIYYENRQLNLEQLAARLEARAPRSGTVLLKADGRTDYELVAAISVLCIERGLSVVLATNPEAEATAVGGGPGTSGVGNGG